MRITIKNLFSLIFIASFFILHKIDVCAIGMPLISIDNEMYTISEAITMQYTNPTVKSSLPFEINRDTDSNTLYLSHKKTSACIAISVTSLDDASFEILREYYDDHTSSDGEIFDKFISLKKSYIPAALDHYQTSFLYGDSQNPSSESIMKLFHEGKDIAWGQIADVYLYNILKSTPNQHEETIHLDIITGIPSSYSVIDTYITIEKGDFTAETINSVNDMLSSIIFEDLPYRYTPPIVFYINKIIHAANSGIYPTQGDSEHYQQQLAECTNEAAGYKIKYPATYIPHLQNNLGCTKRTVKSGNIITWNNNRFYYDCRQISYTCNITYNANGLIRFHLRYCRRSSLC